MLCLFHSPHVTKTLMQNMFISLKPAEILSTCMQNATDAAGASHRVRA